MKPGQENGQRGGGRGRNEPLLSEQLPAPFHGISNEELPILPLYFPTSALVTPRWMTGLHNPKRWGGVTLWIEDWRAR